MLTAALQDAAGPKASSAFDNHGMHGCAAVADRHEAILLH
jgi:hypothetical protein